MIRSYASPLAFKEALEARLRARAQQEGRTLGRVRQVLVMERFLARSFMLFDEAAVLKGGLVLDLRLERARATKDVDMRLVGRADRLLEKLQAAGQLDLGDFLRFEVRSHAAHPVIEADGLPYQGRRFQVEAQLAGRRYGDPFGLDASLAEPLVGQPELLPGRDLLAFIGVPAPTLRVYPVATHLAEKLHAYTLPRLRPNTRVKDLPDIALLASVGPLDAAALRDSIQQLFANRATHPVPERLPDPPPAWDPVYTRMAQKDGLGWESLSDLTSAVRGFLDPVLSAAEVHTWEPEGWHWSKSSNINHLSIDPT